MNEAKLLKLAEAYKEQIFAKLSESAPGRIGQIDCEALTGKTIEEMLALLYLKGVAEALDAFDQRTAIRMTSRGQRLMRKGRASTVSEAASARRAAVTLFLGSIMSIFLGLGVWAAWHPQPYPRTPLQRLQRCSRL